MYHEEKIINGVLCWRNTPEGEWREYTQQQLTQMLSVYRPLSRRRYRCTVP